MILRCCKGILINNFNAINQCRHLCQEMCKKLLASPYFGNMLFWREEKRSEEKRREEQSREEKRRAEKSRKEKRREEKSRAEKRREEQRREEQKREEKRRAEQRREEKRRAEKRREEQSREEKRRAEKRREEQSREEKRRDEKCKMWICEYVKMWRCEDVKKWRCEDVKMWRCNEHVWFQLFFEKTPYAQALRRSQKKDTWITWIQCTRPHVLSSSYSNYSNLMKGNDGSQFTRIILVMDGDGDVHVNSPNY